MTYMRGTMMDTALTIPALVTSRAERLFARRPVVSCIGQDLVRTTWGEVVERARRLGRGLADLGVRPSDRVATFAWNTHRHLEAYLAIPGIGAVLHTLNIRLFPDQIAYIVEHADDRVILCERSLLPLWRQVEAKLDRPRPLVILPDQPADAAPAGDHGTAAEEVDYEELVARSEPAPWAELPEDAAAAMCYTSGTTGNPKGVVYTHRSSVLHSFAAGLAETIALTSRDTVLAVVPMFHANSWGLPYASAMLGASLVLPGRDLSPAALCRLIETERVSIAAGVPTIWLGILDHWRHTHCDLSSLRLGVCGGSALPPALWEAFVEEVGVPILQAWGMTETSPIGTVARLPAEVGDDAPLDERRRFACSQGVPVPGVDLRLVGDDGCEVPWDGRSLGEIQVRGPWVTGSYYRDDDPSKFVDGWLRTGDVATVDEWGYVRIADRTKDLIKSGGEWISSVELESHLMAHPAVAEAAVIAVPHPRWDERPLACVVLRPEARGRVAEQELIEHLRPRVAKWWLPDAVVFIDEIPKTSVGKFDKKVLRARFAHHPTEAAQEAPASDRAR